jgi:hypothetical protein
MLAQTFLEMCMYAKELSEVDEMHRGMRHKMLHEELLRSPAVFERIGLRKTAIKEKSGWQNFQSSSRSV